MTNIKKLNFCKLTKKIGIKSKVKVKTYTKKI